jgi:hypothetical protein
MMPAPVDPGDFQQPAGKRTARFERLTAFYKRAALLCFNLLVVFVVLNLVAWGAISAWHRITNDDDKISHGYSAEDLRIVYPDLTDAQRTALRTENFGRPVIFTPFMEIKEEPIHGTYVNVSEAGFRVNPPQGPWPIDPTNYNIFVIGGSTVFGYGVADDQTIPCYLQARIAKAGDHGRKTCVYNFGAYSYCSTQERIEFEQFLQSGIKPDLAVFIDGLADFSYATGVLPYTGQITEEFDPHDRLGRELLDVATALPIGRGARHLIWGSAPTDDTKADTKQLSQVIDKYVWNKTAIERLGTADGVGTVFVFQPVPMYKYDLTYHLFKGGVGSGGWGHHVNGFDGYPMMAKYVAEHPMGDDFLWLADMQEGIHKPLYCDQVFYTAEFNNEIAGEIEKFLAARKPAR